MRSALILFAVIFFSHAGAEDEGIPAPSNIGTNAFPRILNDLRVTFHLYAPNANKVQLGGGAGLVKEPLDLVRNEDRPMKGFWSVTTPPAVPGFHYYWFVVDGVKVNDPSSSTYFGWARECSGIEIPEKDAEFYLPKDVPHGDVRVKWYHSKVTEKWRRVFVYTPPDYDANAQTRYPVLYLLHGSGENERGWIEQGKANFIVDNLIAGGKAVPMILVMDTGYALRPDQPIRPPTNGYWNPNAAFEKVLLEDLISLIDSSFRTKSDAQNRAMAGLSMGSGQTLQITLKHLDKFAWIAGMSGPPRQNFDVKTSFDGVFNDAAAFNQKVKLFWLGAGTAEAKVHEAATAVHEALDKAGIKNVFFSSPDTDHEWQTWRRSLNDVAQRLFRE